MASEAIAACRLGLYSCEPQMNRMTLHGTLGPVVEVSAGGLYARYRSENGRKAVN